ncbi:hypothetical protein NDA10_007205 [Ustilago hordei]|nr:hypothetical protein NDA10_007205 [Ustilago hordei]UTT89952.1 hypothetical protein NDA17_006113 [Ustilago hordei]
MARLLKGLSVALVAMLYVVFLVTNYALADLVPRSPRHSHRALHRAFVGKRASAEVQDCPESNSAINSYVGDEIKKLSSASEEKGGQEQVAERDLTGTAGNPHVQVKVKSSTRPNGSSHSWSWSWSSHSSSSSSSSSTSSTNDGTSLGSTSPYISHLGQSDQHQKPPTQGQPSKTSQPPQPLQRYTEIRSSYGQDTSDSTHETTKSVQNKDGRVVDHTVIARSHSSSAHSSYSRFSNVFHYVMAGHTEPSSNIAPFSNAQVEWMRSPAQAVALSAFAEIGEPIPRPARAEICNRRFPFTGRQYTIEEKDHRFSQPFSKEALDPVSKMALDLHNNERARYGLRPLQWNVELANMAACWADLKAYGHSQDHFCATGENIAMGLGDPCYSNPLEGMKNAIMAFLDEDRNWAQNPQMSERTGHWTQTVWKDTLFVGCAVAQRKDFMQGYGTNEKAAMYIVCEYYPPGNVQGEYEHQVPAVRPMPQLRSTCSANEKHGS